MHETVICNKIKQDVLKLAAGKKVNSVVLGVGELAALPPDEIEHHLQDIVDFKVKVKTIKAVANCVCGFKGHPEILERGHDYCIYTCPKCGIAPKLSAGDEIKIREIKCA